MRLLDLFSGAGGAAVGYKRAGFYVVGVDIKPQPRYAGDEFIQADALTFPLEGFDVIHASPPCQRWAGGFVKNRDKHPDHIAAIRGRILDTLWDTWTDNLRGAYVIENVPGAPLAEAVTICGGALGCVSGDLQLHRHRKFEKQFAVVRDAVYTGGKVHGFCRWSWNAYREQEDHRTESPYLGNA